MNLRWRSKVNDLENKNDVLQDSQANICNNLTDYEYINDTGCFPIVYRGDEVEVYVKN